MSHNIPFEIQAEIIKRLPVKSLVRFRSVSKTYKSLIDSSDFIAHYSPQHQHLLVRYEDSVTFEQKYVSIVDDDTFPQHKVPMTLPESVKHHDVIGCSHGLLCFYVDGSFPRTVVLWNISIRKGVDVVVPNVEDGLYTTTLGFGMYTTTLGFGVCRETNDPKIVKVTYIKRESDIERISCIPWQVEVFTLSTRAWRSPYSNLPRKSVQFDYLYVVIDGCLYWLAIDWITMDGEFRPYNLIISFDVTSEEFREVNLPHSLAHQYRYMLCMSKLRESLVVVERGVEADNNVFSVWMMEDAVPKSFTKLFTFSVDTPLASVKGFSKSGAPMVEIAKLEYDHALLVVYEPESKHMNNLGIAGMESTFIVYPYMETLLLLDQSDLTDCIDI